jgi:glutaredoxin
LTVYSTLGCPHCQRCKKALDAAGLAYDVVDVADAAARAALEARCGLPTVPQVYLDEERVGGADDTLAALADGWLLERDIARVEPKRD